MLARPGRGCKRRPLDRRTRHGASSCSVREPSCARDAPGALQERSRSRATGWGAPPGPHRHGRRCRGHYRRLPCAPLDRTGQPCFASRSRDTRAAGCGGVRALPCLDDVAGPRTRSVSPFHPPIESIHPRSWRFARRSMRRSCRSILRSCQRCIPRVCIRMMAPSANLAAWRAGRGVVTTAALAPFLGCWTSPSPRPSHRPSGAARARRPWPEGIEPSGAEVENDRTQPHPLGAGDDWAAYARPCLGNPHRPDRARDAPAAFR